jgi:hypothetical protein
MPPTLLFQDTFKGEAGTVNLEDHTPTPSGGGTWIYEGAADRFRVVPLEGEYADASISATGSVARLYLMPPGPMRFRVGGTWLRENVDFVGGFFEFYCYIPALAPGVWDFKDCLKLSGQRHTAGSISLSADWIKAASEPAPAVQNIAFYGEHELLGNGILDFWVEVDEPNALVSIYSAPFGTTPGDPAETLLSQGNLPDELVAHATADRLTGWSTQRAASGLVAFRNYGFSAWDMGVPVVLTGPPCTLLLTVFDDDKTTTLWDVASDPLHARPYLKEPEQYGEQQVDMAVGAASISTVTVTVPDVHQTPGDQDSGYITERLAALGVPDLAGRRCRLIRFDPNGDAVVIADGPAGTPRLTTTYAGFSWDIRDTRETERAMPLFELVGPSSPVQVGSAPTAPSEPGAGYDFDWDVVVSP